MARNFGFLSKDQDLKTEDMEPWWPFKRCLGADLYLFEHRNGGVKVFRCSCKEKIFPKFMYFKAGDLEGQLYTGALVDFKP